MYENLNCQIDHPENMSLEFNLGTTRKPREYDMY